MSDHIVTVTDATFSETVGGSDLPVLVDFWAPWCGPCRALAPVLDELAAEHAGRLTVAKLDVDDNPETANRFGVMSVPTLIVFVAGEPATRLVGVRSKSDLEADLGAHLGR